MAPPTPQAVVPLDSFTRHLNKTFSAIVQTVQGSLSTTRHPVPVNADWLANQVREMFTGDYLVVSNDSSTASLQLANAKAKLMSGLGTLIRLPREIRDMVFLIAIASGNVAITRASKILNQETRDILIKHGVCRMNIGYEGAGLAKEYPAFNPTQDMANVIQTLHVRARVNSGYDGPRTNLKSLTKFVGSNVQRRNCRVRFISSFDQDPPTDVLNLVASFTGFEQIVIELVCASDPGWIDDLRPAQRKSFFTRRHKLRVLVHQIFERDFAAGPWRCDDYSAVVTYRPRIREVA